VGLGIASVRPIVNLILALSLGTLLLSSLTPHDAMPVWLPVVHGIHVATILLSGAILRLAPFTKPDRLTVILKSDRHSNQPVVEISDPVASAIRMRPPVVPGFVGAIAFALTMVSALVMAQETPEKGPEDVPAVNMFDPGAMKSTLVVPRTRVERFRTPAVDVHSHAYAKTPEAIAEWVKLMDRLNVRTTFILTGETGAAFRELAKEYAEAYPGRFIMFAGLDPTGVDSPEYGAGLRRRLREDVAAGAAGLGELTDKGLGLVRLGETPYFIDDTRFDPLWDEAGNLGVPVFVHIAEPAAFYEPADEKNELRRSANWSLYGKGTPGFGALLEKFESVLSRHPRTQFVAVHGFNLANDLGAVGALLDRHPNVQIDFAARMWELARQPFTARRFMVARADRILFGTDNDPVLAMYLAHVRQMETEDEWFWPADAEWWRGYGLGLPSGVLRKIYASNADKLLGRRIAKQEGRK
jgi:predicted TIM-barrel fold metal-dependent hydrolase